MASSLQTLGLNPIKAAPHDIKIVLESPNVLPIPDDKDEVCQCGSSTSLLYPYNGIYYPTLIAAQRASITDIFQVFDIGPEVSEKLKDILPHVFSKISTIKSVSVYQSTNGEFFLSHEETATRNAELVSQQVEFKRLEDERIAGELELKRLQAVAKADLEAKVLISKQPPSQVVTVNQVRKVTPKPLNVRK